MWLIFSPLLYKLILEQNWHWYFVLFLSFLPQIIWRLNRSLFKKKNQHSNSYIQCHLYKLPANLLPSCDQWALNRSLIKPVSALVRASITLAFRREVEWRWIDGGYSPAGSSSANCGCPHTASGNATQVQLTDATDRTTVRLTLCHHSDFAANSESF